MQLFSKRSGLPANRAVNEYVRNDAGVVELESSSMPRHADITEVVVCSLAVLLMLCASAMAYGEFISTSAIVAYAITSAITIAIHQVIGPRALQKGRSQAQLVVSFLIVGLAVAISVFLLQLVWGGFASLANGMIDRLNDIYNLYIARLPGANASEVASIAFMIVVALLFSLAASIFMQLGSRVILPVVLLGFMTLGRGFSISQGIAVPAIAFVGGLMYLAIQTRFRITARALAFGALVPVLMAVGLWGVSAPFHSSPAISDVRESFGASFREFRYGSDTLPLGRICDSSDMNKGEDERLVVKADKNPQNDVLLRGYVGCTWAGNRWVQIDDQVYYGSWQGMMEWFGQNGFDPQTQVANYDDFASAEGVMPTKINLVVNSVGAYRLFVYSPYTLLSTDARYELNHDAQMNSTAFLGAQVYSETVADENPERLLSADVEDLTKNEDSVSFAEAEMVYRAFVHEKYVDISDEDAILAKHLLLGDDWEDQQGRQDSSLYSMVSRVRLMLQLQAYYDNAYAFPGLGSTNSDSGRYEQVNFLKSFLEDDHRGNSTSFATAAVLAFRSQGVPARYVEGYRLPASRFVEDGAEYSATAGNYEAHAWVEVYRDGVGWIPVEVTPGFYTEIREATSVVEVERNVEGGPQEDSSQGLVTGATAVEQNEDDGEDDSLGLFEIFLIVIGIIVALLLALVLALELQRKVRLDNLRNQCESSDQYVQVRALFDDMAYSFAAAGIPFDKGRPEDFVDEVDYAFPKILREEYVRMLELMRKSVFGGKMLKVHEVNTLARLAKRLNEELPEVNGREKLVNRYKYLR